MQKQFRQWALSRLCDGAYQRMTLIKKIDFWLESWCSYYYGSEIMSQYNNRKRSPSGLEWTLYSVPWYGKYLSKLEFQFRYLSMKKLPDNIVGRFPFYKRKTE